VTDPNSLVSIRLAGSSNSPMEAIEFLRKSDLFQDVAGEDLEAFANFNDGNETHRLFSVYTTRNFFTLMGTPMLHGRGIIPSDPKEVTVLSYRSWMKYFRGDPSVVGRAIRLDGRACTIVGILPEHHRTVFGFGLSPDIYLPRWLDATTLQIYARLKPGMSLGEARAGLETVAKRMDSEMPRSEGKYAQEIRVSPIAGYARFAGEPEIMPIGIFFLVLLFIVGLVLLIACVNVAILLLTRGSARRGETAIRLALGGSRTRLLQQFLAESVLLALLGTVLGVMLSQITASLLARIQLPLPVPIHLQIAPDWRVLAYSALLATVATLVCGLLPASQSLKAAITPDLARERKAGLRNTLVTAQIAISVVVLTTGFLFLRNLVLANSISPGFDVRHTLCADVNLPPGRYENPQSKAHYIDTVLGQLGALPGIESVAAARLTPFTDNVSFGVRLHFPDNGQERRAYFKWNAVTPLFFQTMGIPLLRGSTFSTANHGEKVIIVNQTFVERYLGDKQPIGTLVSWMPNDKTQYRIIGVVAGTKTVTIGEDPQPQLYEPLAQIDNDRLRVQFVLRSTISPAQQLEPVRRTLHRIDPMASAEVETEYSSIGLAFLPSQVGAVLLGSVGVLGLLLTTVGLYGVMAYSVIRRTREIGIRMAVGASRSNVSRMVLRNVAVLTLTGSALGLFLALFLTRPLAMFLVPGLKPNDPLSFGAVLLVMMVTGLLAAWGPVHRAMSIDPNSALRYE
jgi:predicted permease